MPQAASADADDGGDEREHDAFGEQLADDPAAAGAERCTNGELAGARGAARQQQVGDVAARDEQHEADGAEQREHPPRVVADEIVECRHGDVKSSSAASRGKCHAQSLRIRAQLAERLFARWRRASVVRKSAGSARRASPCARP